LPIAIALARRSPDVRIVIATTNDRLTQEVRHLLVGCGVSLPVVQLGLRRPLTRFAARHFEALLPISKIGIYRDNLDFFASFDAMVVTEKSSLLLKSRYGLDRLRLIHTRHGAGDRAIGFDRASAGFDHVLVAGPKIRERLVDEAGVSPDRLSTIGYPKFDMMSPRRTCLPFEGNGKPTVLYNPHVSPHLSSWYRDGRAVLEYFLADDRYNLIFAPHVMLFHRRFAVTIDRLRIGRPGSIEKHIRDAPNIHVDLGSRFSTDMTYTRAADIYLGDVSSQIYEFLHQPRPCLFLDSHETDWHRDPNFAHWHSGEVFDDPGQLGIMLDRALQSHPIYRPTQERLFRRSIDLRDESSASRGADAVLRFLSQKARMPQPSIGTAPHAAGAALAAA
jgi:hypothetical protein